MNARAKLRVGVSWWLFASLLSSTDSVPSVGVPVSRARERDGNETVDSSCLVPHINAEIYTAESRTISYLHFCRITIKHLKPWASATGRWQWQRSSLRERYFMIGSARLGALYGRAG